MSHLDRKELKRPDAFLSKAERFIAFVNTNSRTILMSLGVLFVAGLGVAFYQNRVAQKNESAAGEYYVREKAFKTSLGSIPKTQTDWQQKASKELAELEKITNDFAGTESSFEALLLLGDTYYDRADSTRAIEYYKKAIDEASSKQKKSLATLSLAYAYENANEPDRAIEKLQAVLASGDLALKSDALMALGRNYEIKGDKAAAIRQYEQAAREFPNSPVARVAEAQKKQLGG